jgi:hypothetical protein
MWIISNNKGIVHSSEDKHLHYIFLDVLKGKIYVKTRDESNCV